MARRRKQGVVQEAELSDLMRKLLIVHLARAGLQQHAVRKIVGCNMALVVEVMKHLGDKG